MKFIKNLGFLITILCTQSIANPALTPAEQQELLRSVKELQAEVSALKKEVKANEASGLKVQDYKNESTDSETRGLMGATSGPQLSSEESKQLMKILEEAKAKSLENQKILLEIEKEM